MRQVVGTGSRFAGNLPIDQELCGPLCKERCTCKQWRDRLWLVVDIVVFWKLL